ncbi:MAG: hypothetical protein JJT81_12595 [Rubellimicrobium sp.]|nr:hypothetical protein [Rubellimicrobium sp.]
MTTRLCAAALASFAALALVANPAAAFDRQALAALAGQLGSDDATARVEAAVAACLLVTDAPNLTARVIDAFPQAGWTAEALDQGFWEFGRDGTFVMLYDTGTFCMVEAMGIGTPQITTALTALVDRSGGGPVQPGTDAYGCQTFLLSNGIEAQLSGEGQDPACTSSTGSALRFARPFIE